MSFIFVKKIHRQIILTILLINIAYLLWTHPKFNKKIYSSKPLNNSENIDNFSNTSVFCIILTRPVPDVNRLNVVREAWAKYCDDFVYVAKLAPNQTNLISQFPILQPNKLDVDEYLSLTKKVFYTFRDVYLQYANYDWYLKADDDSFIFIENLKMFLSNKNKSEPVTYGYNYQVYVTSGYHSGGAGYVLSKESLFRLGKSLVEDENFCLKFDIGVEDYDIARCLRKLDVYPGESIDEYGRERFHPFTVIDHIYGFYPSWIFEFITKPLKGGSESVSETSISFHYMEIDRLEHLGKVWQRYLDKKRNNKKIKQLSYYLYTII